MARPKTPTTVALEKIAARAGFTTKYARELHRAGMPLTIKPALQWISNRPDPVSPTDPTDDDSPQALRRQRIKLTKAQAERAEHMLAVQRGEYISIEEHNAIGARIGAAMDAAFKAFEREVPTALQGLQIPAARQRMRDEVRKMRILLADDQSALWKENSHPSSPLETEC